MDTREGWSPVSLSELNDVQGGFWKGCLIGGGMGGSIIATGIAIVDPPVIAAGVAAAILGCLIGGAAEDSATF